MPRRSRAALALAVLVLASVWSGSPAAAGTIAGNGYSASYAGESAFLSLPALATGQFSGIFFNDGGQTWLPGVVGLLVCLPDKVTCNVPSPNAAYASNWYTPTVYATVTSPVTPGTNGFFIYSFVVPAMATPGTVATFNGDVGLIGSGALLRPSGYFHSNTVPVGAPTLTITPASLSLPVNTTFQLTASSPSDWTVIGGCGAITSNGLFAATAMNGPSQPCKVVAVSGGASASVPVSVFGAPASITCAASSPTIPADGISTVTVTASLRDVNGSFVSTAVAPPIFFNNITPALDTMSPIGTQTPVAGRASVTLTTTTAGGDMQVTATATGLTGCSAIVRSIEPGYPVSTTARFLTDRIAADGSSTTLRVETMDAAGYRSINDNFTTISISRAISSTSVCPVDSLLYGQVVNGRIEFPIHSTNLPGLCVFDVSANNTSIRGSTATLTTVIVSNPTRLVIAGNDTPKTAGNDAVVSVIVDVVDTSGQRVTSSSALIVMQLDTAACTGAPGGDITMGTSSVSAAQGRATFTLRSTGAYPSCGLIFTSVGLNQTAASITFAPAAPDHLSCSITPTAILNDGIGTATLTVRLRDAFNNLTTAGGPFSISIARSAGNVVTTVLTGTPQLTVNGAATFVLRSTTNIGADSYDAQISPGTQPSLPVPSTLQACSISVQSVIR